MDSVKQRSPIALDMRIAFIVLALLLAGCQHREDTLYDLDVIKGPVYTTYLYTYSSGRVEVYYFKGGELVRIERLDK